MPDEINQGRRQFFTAAAASLAAAQLGLIGSAAAQSSRTNASLEPLKQIDAGLLNVGYAESGPAQGPVVILLHGWPYDIHSFVDVAPCWPLPATASSCRICAVTEPRASLGRNAAQRSAFGHRGRHDRADGCAQDREGGRCWFRLGRAHREHHGGALAGARQRHGLRERLSDRQSASRPNAAAAKGRAGMVVSILLRHRARPRRLRQVSPRIFKAHLAARFAQVGLR